MRKGGAFNLLSLIGNKLYEETTHLMMWYEVNCEQWRDSQIAVSYMYLETSNRWVINYNVTFSVLHPTRAVLIEILNNSGMQLSLIRKFDNMSIRWNWKKDKDCMFALPWYDLNMSKLCTCVKWIDIVFAAHTNYHKARHIHLSYWWQKIL